jgi:hypothetical protein
LVEDNSGAATKRMREIREGKKTRKKNADLRFIYHPQRNVSRTLGTKQFI